MEARRIGDYLDDYWSVQRHRPHYMKTGDYIDEKTGLLRCGICGDFKEKFAEYKGKQIIVFRPCRHEAEITARALKEMEDYQFKMMVDANKKQCFRSSVMATWTFDADEGHPHQRKVMEMAQNYARNFQRMLDYGAGMIIMGDVGTGKTFIAAAITNAVLERGYTGYFSSVPRLLYEMSDPKRIMHDQLIKTAEEVDLLVLDDLGAERPEKNNDEKLFEIIEARNRVRKPLIITTNLTFGDLTNPTSHSRKRIYDRILEMCVYKEVLNGKSLRPTNSVRLAEWLMEEEE